MGGVKAAKVGIKASSKASVTDGNGLPSSSPRVVSEELMALLRRGNASAVKRYLKSGADVNQVLHVPQLDKSWGYAAPAAAASGAAAAAAATAAPAAPAGTASENKRPSSDGRTMATEPAAGAAAAVSVPAPPPSGHWPLILLACAVSSAGVVEILLKGGANPNARNMYGLTALVAAIYNDGLAATEKLALVKLLQRHGFSLFGVSCEALGERATAVTALLHQLAMGEPEAREAAVPLVDWLLQHEPLPHPPDQLLFQHLCFSLALEPAALLTWLPLLQRRTTYVPGSPAYAELVVGVVAAAHQLKDARAAAAAQAMAVPPPSPAAPALPSPSPLASSAGGGWLFGGVADDDLGSSGWAPCTAQQQQEQQRSCGKSGLELSSHGPQLPVKKKYGAVCAGGAGSASGGHGGNEIGTGSATASVVNGGGAKACGGSGGATVRHAVAPTPRTEGSLLAERERSRQGARARVAARAAATASAAPAAAVVGEGEGNPAGLLLRGGGGGSEEALVLRAFLECGLNPNVPMCADGLLPMQRFLEKPELLGVLLEGGMDPRVRAGVSPLDLTFLHSYALIGRFQSGSEVALQACAVLLSRDPGLLWLRCAGLTAFQLALAHANLGMVEYLAPLMGSEQQEAATTLRQRMLGGPIKCCGTSKRKLDNDGDPVSGKRALSIEGDKDDQDDDVAARVWDPASPAAAAAAVAAASAASPVMVTGQDSEVVSSYRLLCLALQRPELWGNDMSGLMRQVPLMDIRQVLTLLDVLNSPNLFNVVAFLEHCRTFAQRVILQVLQLGAEGHELMQAAVPPRAVAVAVAFLRANPDNIWLQSMAKYFPPLVDAMVAGEDTRELMLVAPQMLLARAEEISLLPPDLVQAACESARAAMLLENGFHCPRPQLDDLEGPLRRYMEAGYHRLLLRLLLRLPAASKQVWHDIHVMAYIPEVCAAVALQLCNNPALTAVVAEALTVVQACMAGRPAAHVKRGAAAAAAVAASVPRVGDAVVSAPAEASSYAEAVDAVVAHLAAHLGGMGPANSAAAASAATGTAATVATATAAASTQRLHMPTDDADSAAAAPAESPTISGAPTAAMPSGNTCAPLALPTSPSPATQPAISPCSPSPPCSTRSSSGPTAVPDAPDASIAVTITSSSSSSSSTSGSSSGSSSSDEQGSGGSTTSSGFCSPARAASPPPPLAAAAAAVSADASRADAVSAAEATLSPPSECDCFPPELAYLEDVVVEQTELLQSLYALMAVCSLCSHLLCPDFGLAMCSREFRTRMTGISDAAIDQLAERHGGAASAAKAAGSTAAPAAPASSAAAATAAALLAAYPRSSQLSLDQLYAQLLGSMSPVGADQKELVESRREFLKQVLAMDSMWRAMQQRQQEEARAEEGQQEAEQTIKADGTQDMSAAAETAAAGPQVDAPLPPRRELRGSALVEEARQAVLSHPVIWTVVQQVAALPSAPGPRPGMRVLWDDDNTPIYVLMSLAARRAVHIASGMHPRSLPTEPLQPQQQ
ncbi:hypothetical protein VaNZ11_010532 [Volvox africanus]|uniref:Uncharacterized protein n=1 Tax=Volvox africanus TaxID=51714 RepID=A0ABQ5SAF9_9CHLO|nr:hypothetical protein VaNZ11_010532 [Volvox africanus]